jgi:hypothetical protein
MTSELEALGGRLEVRAMFDDTEVVAIRRPDEERAR